LQADVFIRLVALVHAARAADDRGDARLVEQASFSAEGYRGKVLTLAKQCQQSSGLALRAGRQSRIAGKRAEVNGTGVANGFHPWQEFAFGESLQLQSNLVRIVGRQIAHLEVEAALGWHDVQRPATPDQPGLHGGIGRVEAQIVARRVGQLRSNLAKLTDQRCRILDGIDPLRRVGGVAGRAVHLATHCQLAFVAEHGAHLGGFADQADGGLLGARA